MQYIIAFILCLTWVMPGFAASCQDMQDVVGSAVQERNGRIRQSYNILMPDPESERELLSACLSAVNSIGDAFSLGVTLPGMDQIVNGMCSQVNSLIQEKINEAHSELLNTINRIGSGNLFRVHGTDGEYVVRITDKLQ